ncbi:GNAT family N-acetyltransferase [Pseudoalteromonas sp. SaAl2]
MWPAPASPQAQQLLLLPGARAVDSLLGSQAPLLDVSNTLKADISLQPFELEKDWPWYEQEYNQFLTENPAMANIVPISDKEELSESIEAGLCSMAFYKGQPLGMVMGEVSEELGFDGLLVSDIFITKQFRGQGLASPMQRLYYQQHTQDFELFFWLY